MAGWLSGREMPSMQEALGSIQSTTRYRSRGGGKEGGGEGGRQGKREGGKVLAAGKSQGPNDLPYIIQSPDHPTRK